MWVFIQDINNKIVEDLIKMLSLIRAIYSHAFSFAIGPSLQMKLLRQHFAYKTRECRAVWVEMKCGGWVGASLSQVA